MNQLSGIIKSIETDGHISLVSILAEGTEFFSLVIDTPQTAAYLQMGNKVFLIFKETEMSIAKHISGGLSIRNRFHSIIRAIEPGKILSKITLDFKGQILHAIITTRSLHSLHLQVGDQVEGLVKTNEISIMEAV
jgi:molybdate transport system regulatory protein